MKTWDADSFEITVNGKMFFVNAIFDWEWDAVDYEFDARAFQGRDTMARIPFAVSEIEIFGPDEMGECVELALVELIKETLISSFRETMAGTFESYKGQWM